MIDSQMDDMIKEKLALKEQVDSLEHNLSKQIKENESLLQTFTVFKNESREKESKYMENEIDLGKKIKELDNIVYKVGQSTQTVSIISDKHVAMSVIDDDETLILEEVSRLKMKLFVPQQELSAKQAFWFNMSNPTTEAFVASTVTVEAPSELYKVSLVNESLKKIKFHLAKFDKVVKITTTSDALTEAQLQDKDTTICKLKEIIKSLRVNNKEENVNHDRSELETINEDLENSVVVQIVLWYLDSGCSIHMTGNRSLLMNSVSKFLGIVRFRNDQVAKIMGYGDYQLGNVIISRKIPSVLHETNLEEKCILKKTHLSSHLDLQHPLYLKS
nr:integrase, catalytic region, zinc finger, CCHC-type, peptidase aspartic, catalytic [Tanacetum cinerariifolium]